VAFDKYYFETHVPIAKTMPGLRKYEVTHGPIGTPAGPSPYHLIATLYFDDLAALANAAASPQGRAAGADVPNFAPNAADVEVLILETREI
jgi:uncharacterized protein (TIGR02118 family)